MSRAQEKECLASFLALKVARALSYQLRTVSEDVAKTMEDKP